MKASPIPADQLIDQSRIPEPRTNIVLSAPIPNPNEVNSSLGDDVRRHLGAHTPIRAVEDVTIQETVPESLRRPLVVKIGILSEELQDDICRDTITHGES